MKWSEYNFRWVSLRPAQPTWQPVMNLISGFINQCSTRPDQTAFIQDERRLSYDQIKHRAAQISSFLSSKKSPSIRVAVALERGIDAAVSIFGILISGSCYIPLDIKNPASRLRFIVDDADVQFVIGQNSCPEWIEEPHKWLDIDKLALDTPSVNPSIDVSPESLAAILYTSGSTGTPKGVALSHRAMLNFAEWSGQTFNISPEDQIASLAPFHFDLSVFDLFTGLNSGATVNFIPAWLTLSPSRLTGWLGENRITTWYTVPSLLTFIALKGSLGTTSLSELKTILFAGEVFPTEQLIKLCNLLPDVDLYNLYGPTETNVCCYWPVERNCLQKDQPIPIGTPACNSQLRISDDTDELWVKSKNNLSGYWQRGRLTQTISGDAWYQTGDKVSLNSQGEYCYHGRLDRMLKCSGYRVEPAEIETVIRQLPEVENCAVIGIPDTTSGQRPAAVIVLKSGHTLDAIIKPIKQKLPVYMQPCKFVVMETLPYLSNGKTDYPTLEKELQNR